MTWERDASLGFLGRTPPARAGMAPQPLHRDVVVPDVEEALTQARPALEVFRAHLVADGAPLYSGGVLDSWPAWVVDLLKVAKPEWEAIKAWLAWEASQAREG